MSTVFAANPFELLGEDDSGEGVATGKVVAQPKKEEKPAAKPVASKPIKEEAKPAARKTGDTDNKDSRPKGDSRPDRRPKDLSRKEDRGDDAAGAGSPGQDRPYRPRGDRFVTGTERRERRERENDAAGGAPRGGRVFDRRSGTGRGREEKRGGAGRGNWGSLNDEEKAAPSDERKATAEEGAAEGEATEAGESNETAAAEPAPKRELTAEELERQKEREKEEKLMTLDEYLKIKKGVAVALPEPRKAGEGEDQKKWAKYTAAKSDKDEEVLAAKPAKEKKAKEPTKVAADPALLKFKSEAQRRARESRDRFREERSDRFREERADRTPRPAAQPARKATVEPAFGQADFPALKA